MKLRYKFALTVFCFQLVLAMAIAPMLLSVHADHEWEAAEEVAAGAAALVEPLVSEAVVTGNLEALRTALVRVRGLPQIATALVAGPDGTVIASAYDRSLGRPVADLVEIGSGEWSAYALPDAGRNLGTIYIAKDMDELAKATHHIWTPAAAAVSLLLFLTGGVALFLGSVLASRLEGMASAVGRMALVDGGTRLDLGGRDEVAGVGAAINAMLDRLQQQSTELAESETRYRGIIDSLIDIYYRTDSEGRLVLVSRSSEELLGYSASETLGRRLTDFYVDPQRREALLKQLKDGNGQVTGFEAELKCKDGSTIWLSTNSSVLLNAEGEVIGVEGTARDISAEVQARRQRDRFLEAIESLPDGIALFDKDQRIVSFNRAYRKALGPGGALVEPGMTFAEILRQTANLEGTPQGFANPDEWVAWRLKLGLGDNEPFELQRAAAWFRVIENRLPDGSVIIAASDITQRKLAEEAARREHERFRAAMAVVPSGLAFYDADDRLEYFNQALCDLHGVELNGLVGRSFEDVSNFVSGQREAKGLTTVGSGEHARRERIRRHRDRLHSKFELGLSDGRWFLVREQPIAGGGSVSVHTEITEQKRLQEVALANEARFRDFAEITSDWFWETDASGAYVMFSGSFEKEYGTSEKDLIGVNRLDHLAGIVDMNARHVQAHVEDFLTRRPIRNFEVHMRRGNGTVGWHRINAKPIFDGRGVFRGYRAAVEDITERKRIELALRESQTRFERAEVSGRFGHWWLDLQTNELHWSSAVYALFGLDEDGFQPTREAFRAMMPEEDRELVGRAYHHALEGLEDYSYDHRVIRTDGTVMWVHQNARFVLDADGKPIQLVGTVHDMTARKEAELNLRRSEAHLCLIADSLPVLIAHIDRDRRYRFINRTYETWWQIDRDSTVGKTMVEVMGVQKFEELQESTERVLDGEAFEQESRVTHPDGKTRDVITNYVPDRSESGDVRGYFVLVQDVTERKAVEAAVHENRTLLQTSVDAIDQGLMVFDKEARIRLCNAWVRRFYQLPDGFLEEGTSAYDLVRHGRTLGSYALDDQDDFFADVRGRLEAGSTYHAERRLFDRVVDIRVTPIPHIKSAVCTWTDITERRQAEDHLRERETYWRALIDASSDMLMVLDADCRIRYQSPSVERILGHPLSARLGFYILDNAHPDDVERGAAFFNELLTFPGQVRSVTLRKRHVNGEWRMVEIVGINHLATSAIGGIVIKARDVTETLAKEAQLSQAQKMEALGQLTGGVAHEFNNVLTAIKGFAKLAERQPENVERVVYCVGEIGKAADQAVAVTQQMLDFGRKQDSSAGPVELRSIIADLEKLLPYAISDKVELSLECDGAGVVIEIDANRLKQAILNLSINASHAMPQGGSLSLHCRRCRPGERGLARHNVVRPQDYVALSVQDTGTGIDPEILPRIFEPFFTTKDIGQGTGLGLSMVFAMVQDANGFIDVDSRPGKGTTFTMYFPLCAATAVEQSGEPPEPERRDARRATILVTEDEDAVRRFTSMTLKEAGYDVLLAANAQEAAQIFAERKNDIALLLSDVAMPGKDGPALARELLAIKPDLKVIFVSGHAEGRLSDALPDGNRLNFLSKPFEIGDLIRMIEDVLDEQGEAA